VSFLKKLFGVNYCQICGVEFKKKFSVWNVAGSRVEACPVCARRLHKQASDEAFRGNGRAVTPASSGCSCSTVFLALIGFVIFGQLVAPTPRPAADAPIAPARQTQKAPEPPKVPAVTIGASEQEVLKVLGNPQGTADTGKTRILSYKTQNVIIDARTGKVCGISRK
jgi:hypothetical protein